MKNPKEPKLIQERVHEVIKSEEGEKGGVFIRVVSWIINDKETQRFLEKREFRLKNGMKLFGKAKGFTKDDVNVLVANWDKLEKSLL